MLLIGACKKQDDFLNKKNNNASVVPSTMSDFQGILDDYTVMNGINPNLTVAGCDNIYISDVNLAALSVTIRNTYTWTPDIFQGAASGDWTNPYNMIEHANIVLDGLDAGPTGAYTQNDYNNVKGQALFFRAFCFYCLSQEFCKTYDSSSAATDEGIILRLTSDVNEASKRATVKASYEQMITDLKAAIPLLPVTPLYQTRPSQPAANGLLAKIYLVMGDYKDAAVYSTNYLGQLSALMDFNTIIPKPNVSPFKTYPNNPEIGFYIWCNSDGTSVTSTLNNRAFIDSVFYKSYDSTDLRKTILFQLGTNNAASFLGSYTGNGNQFGGIATNEIYLVRAESYARQGNISGAETDLNALLVNRYKAGKYVPVTTTDRDSLLTRIVLERRKELPMTGQMRWEDLRRLNKEPRFATTLQRVSKGTTYTLAPNDPKYTFPIPDIEITLSGIAQNPR